MERHVDERQLLDALSLSVLATDESSLVTFVNGAATELFRTGAADLIGRRIGSLIEPGQDAAERALLDVLSGNRWHGDLTILRSDGETVLAAVTITPIPGADGGVVGSIIALEDITEVRQAAVEAAESEQRLRLAHAAAELGTWHWNAADGSNVWDAQMYRIYGLAPGAFDGTWEAWVGSIHPDDQAATIATVTSAMEACSPYVLRHRIVRPDGRPSWIEAHGKVLVGPDGRASGTIGCVQDVTERILLQQLREDAAARALLLQEVTADFSRATTPDQVAAVYDAGLARVRAIVDTDQPLTEVDEQLLSTLALQRAIADERAELFRHTTAISEELQHSLAASSLPELDRFEIEAYYAPGGDDLEHVGGDWYDAVSTWGGGLALVVGDVMGRGVRAATGMIHVRAGIRGLLTVEPDPAALLEAADELIARDAPEQFVTAAAALIDPVGGTLSVCNAGHVPLVLVRPDGTAELIEVGSAAPLGVLTRLHREAEHFAIEPGCVVVLVTDGVVESRDHDIDEGVERLRSRMAELAGRPLSELVVAAAALADDRHADDVTVVAARLR